jgi:HEAT repeat protein
MITATADRVEELAQRAMAGEMSAVQALLAQIKRDHDAHQLETLTAIARLDEPALWRDLLDYLATNTWRGRHLPAAAAGVTQDLHRLFVQPFGQPRRQRRAAVREVLLQPPPQRRVLAATLAAELHDREAVPAAVTLLSDHHAEVRIAAARIIQAVPDASAVDALLQNMEERDYGVRSSAVAAMRAIGCPALLALLHRLIERPCGSDFKIAVGHALHWLAVGVEPAAVVALAAALRSPASGVAVPVAADRILRWLRDHPDPADLG